MIQSYRDLKVWQKALDLADRAYLLSEGLPSHQRYILCSQIERSAASVPANIAEGRMRHSQKDFLYHLSVAKGSLAELETLLFLAQKRGYITEQDLQSLLLDSAEVMKMLHGLKSSLSEEPLKLAKT